MIVLVIRALWAVLMSFFVLVGFVAGTVWYLLNPPRK